MDRRSRCHLTRTQSFWLLESWLDPGSRSDLRFWRIQDALVDVFQRTNTADLPLFCPWKLPGDSAHQTLCSCRALSLQSLVVWDDVLLLHLPSSLSWSHPCSSQELEPFSILSTAFWIRALRRQWCCTRTPWSSKNCPKFSACSAKSLNLGKYRRV